MVMHVLSFVMYLHVSKVLRTILFKFSLSPVIIMGTVFNTSEESSVHRLPAFALNDNLHISFVQRPSQYFTASGLNQISKVTMILRHQYNVALKSYKDC